MAAKPCSKCKVEKCLTSFATRSSRKQGYASECKDCKKLYNKEYYQRPGVKEKLTESHRRYRKDSNFKEKESIYRKTYEKNRLNNDVLFKLKKNLRSRISHLIKRKNVIKTNSVISWLGCSTLELKIYLEQQFQSNMSWDNYGMWHVDHIIPLSIASNEEELMKLNHYTNLQPLWALDNIIKGDK